MSDIFTEVDEQVRSERAEAALRRHGPAVLVAVAVALGLALAWWGWRSWRDGQSAEASVAYAHALEAQAAGRTAEAEGAFQRLSTSGPAVYRALSLSELADARLKAGKPAEAAALLDKSAAAAPDPVLKDAAALKAALALLDGAPLAETRRRLEPLSAAGRPFREMAREALAVAKLKDGRAAEARGDFAVLSVSPAVSELTQARAHAALAVIDSGSAAAIPAAVKAAAALPPAAATPPSLPGAGGGPAPSI